MPVVPSTPKPLSRRTPAWAPLRNPAFRSLWAASVVSNIGSWMHDVGAAWLMTSLSKDAGLNALVLAAGSLPMFFLALPAGALADILDRRKILILTQTWALIVTALLAFLTFTNNVTPLVLLGLTFILRAGNALSSPAWQSVVPEMVKRRHLGPAIALGGVSFNIARVLGPTLGGILIGIFVPRVGNLAAPGIVFLIDSISYSAVVWVIYRWKRAPRVSDLPPEHVFSAVKTGLRYVRYSPELWTTLVRTGLFGLFGAVLWALLPLHSRVDLKLDAEGYGVLLCFFGLGALSVGVSFERLRVKFGPNNLLFMSCVLFSLSAVGIALVRNVHLVWLIMLCAGISWPLAMLNFQVAVMRNAPDWVRSRAASLYLLTFMGSSSLGATIWGAISRHSSISTAFLISALGLSCTLVLTKFLRIPEGETHYTPSGHWPDPVVEIEPNPDEGPVLVTREFCIPPDDAAEFIRAMQPVRQIRLREGVLRWSLFQDAAEPTRFVENVLVESWTEHLRQHARVSQESAEIELNATRFHVGEQGPRVSHLIVARPRMLDLDTMDDDD